VSKTFERVVEDLGLNRGVDDARDKVVFHSLRHTFCSWLAINGEPLRVIQELAGHKSIAMTERYSHLSPDRKREAIKRLK
jgi:integrase